MNDREALELERLRRKALRQLNAVNFTLSQLRITQGISSPQLNGARTLASEAYDVLARYTPESKEQKRINEERWNEENQEQGWGLYAEDWEW